MKPLEAKKTKIGERVKWESSGELGKVVDKNGYGLVVKWDDGTQWMYLFDETTHGLLHVQRCKA